MNLIFGLMGALPWVPIFYFFLPPQNTNAIQALHVLHNVQVKTGKRVIVVTPWPFWPWSTANDPVFRSFIQGLNPKIRYCSISNRLQSLVQNLVHGLARLVLRSGDLYRPVSVRRPIRYGAPSTIDHSNLVNEGDRVNFQIPASHEAMLERELRDLGVPPDSWFVCVHARESGWELELNAYDIKHPAGYSHEQENHRNVNIEDYFPAIDHIISRGGMVIRMGDASMKRVNGINGFIDYPFTEQKSMLMDLYLASKCKFVLGCNAGFSSCFVHTFGKPLLMTNFAHPAGTARLPYSNTIMLLLHVKETQTGRVLSLKEIFQPDLCNRNNFLEFTEMGYEWLPNSPEDILEAVKEMLDLTESNAFDSPRTREQELFHKYRLQALDSLWSPFDSKGEYRYSKLRLSESRISATFAARYFAD